MRTAPRSAHGSPAPPRCRTMAENSPSPPIAFTPAGVIASLATLLENISLAICRGLRGGTDSSGIVREFRCVTTAAVSRIHRCGLFPSHRLRRCRRTTDFPPLCPFLPTTAPPVSVTPCAPVRIGRVAKATHSPSSQAAALAARGFHPEPLPKQKTNIERHA